MDIKHLQFSFRMYWANMKGLPMSPICWKPAGFTSCWLSLPGYRFGIFWNSKRSYKRKCYTWISAFIFSSLPCYRAKYSSKKPFTSRCPTSVSSRNRCSFISSCCCWAPSICRGRHSRCYKAISSRPSCSCWVSCSSSLSVRDCWCCQTPRCTGFIS